ncbi:MAG: exopolysaccharide Pel transporter PelG [Acetobacteraceae bacterium]|nr:exopolysaccharide Pel transporter PelG [Acetobacteraceae bacterium]
MTRQRALSGIAAGYVCAALMVAGPWIFTIIGITGLSAIRCNAACEQLPLFRTIVIYNSMFSLVVTSPIAFFAGRHTANELHAGHTDRVFGVLTLVLGLFCLVALLVAVPLYGAAADLDGFTRLAAVQNTLLIGTSWLLIPFLGALRAHLAILVGFGVGAVSMTGFGWLLVDPEAGTLLTAFNASFALADAIMMACSVRRIGARIALDRTLPQRVQAIWELPAAGLAYALGIWADKIIMWFGSPWHDAPEGGLSIAGVMRTMPSYDTAVFWAQLASIPVIAVAFVHVETRLRTLFGALYGRMGAQASLRELTDAVEKIRICVISSIAILFVALAIVAVMAVLFSFVFMGELGLRPSYMSILRISLSAMVFHASAMFCFVFLLYFDLRRAALLIVAAYAVLNTLLTMAVLHAGQPFYGYGSMVAAAITFFLAFTVLLRELPWLHYHAFVTNNSSI